MVRQPGNRSKESSSSSSSSSSSRSSSSNSRRRSSSSSSSSTTFLLEMPLVGSKPARLDGGRAHPPFFVVTSVLLAAAIFLAVVFGRGAGDEVFRRPMAAAAHGGRLGVGGPWTLNPQPYRPLRRLQFNIFLLFCIGLCILGRAENAAVAAIWFKDSGRQRVVLLDASSERHGCFTEAAGGRRQQSHSANVAATASSRIDQSPGRLDVVLV